jgi:hypothetical protein
MEDETKPERSDYQKAQIATEGAYNALVKVAGQVGLKLNPAMGLNEIPSWEAAKLFSDGCHAVLDSLAVIPK